MQTIDIMVAISLTDTDSEIPGGEISAEIVADDEDSAIEALKQLLTDFSAKGGRSYAVVGNEFFTDDSGNDMVSVTIKLNDIPEISWATFYYGLEDLGLDDPEDVDVTELAARWINDFFDEDNEIVIEEI